MKIKSDIIWAIMLIGTAAISFYLGTRTGTFETEGNLNSRIELKAEKIRVLENKVQQLSDELTSRGIFSYPQASLVAEKGNPNATVIITLNGKEEINNLQISKRAFANYSIDSNILFDSLGRKGTMTYLGTLSAHNPVAFEIDEFENEVGIDLIFKSGQNQWQQYIRARKTSDGEIKTFWIITNNNSEVIDKHVDPGFPVNNMEDLTFGPHKTVNYSEIQMNSVFRPYSSEE